jgi:hypothetical protein
MRHVLASPAIRHLARPGQWLRVLAIVVALGAIAYGDQITVFWDDFQTQPVGADPAAPPIGEAWRINEIAANGIDVGNPLGLPAENVLNFGPYRNSATAAIPALGQQAMAAAGNATVRFDYFGHANNGYSQYFDIGGYNPLGEPAFFLRFMPQVNVGVGSRHNVMYRDPAVVGLVDTGLDISSGTSQPVSITADFAAGSYQLGIAGNTVTLPMFACGEAIVDVQFSNYAAAIGSGPAKVSGYLDNVAISVTTPDQQSDAKPAVPELASVWLLVTGAATLLGIWLLRR